MKGTINLFIAVIIYLITFPVTGQVPEEKWNTPKLIGKRYTNRLYYQGPQYLNIEMNNGIIYLANGDSVVNVLLKYNRHLDELIYFNNRNSSLISLDKKPISGFTIATGSQTYRFKKLVINGKAGYYEVLYSGRTEFLASRRSGLSICPTYLGRSGVNENYEFKAEESYLIACKDNVYLPIKLIKKSLFLKFDESKKNEIRKILRKNHLAPTNEKSMVSAWKLLEESGYNPAF